ncbi:MAG: TetR/AcrR family transcriptional regulator [Thermodesulfobacteriota bacterium]|nr:TetR/AcrR family transcriptional regulator [Thermodesulfobacteriota bacterium]
MEDERKRRILDAAVEIIAKKGFTEAKVHEISDGARVGVGTIYSQKLFKNKLDLLLSITLDFWKNLNKQIELRVSKKEHPEQKFYELLAILEELLLGNVQSIYLSKVLHEAIPHIYFIEDEELIKKRRKITHENRKLLRSLDRIIEEGQKQGEFDDALRPTVMRQVLFGSFEFLLYGLSLEASGREKDVGYKEQDVRKAMDVLFNKFLKK